MNRIKFLGMIAFLFKFHPKNRGEEYIQGWYCWPKSSKWPRLRKTISLICGVITGHEISKTEWGWGGGESIDCHCRWCDKVIEITKDEARFRFDTFNEWGKDQF